MPELDIVAQEAESKCHFPFQLPGKQLKETHNPIVVSLKAIYPTKLNTVDLRIGVSHSIHASNDLPYIL